MSGGRKHKSDLSNGCICCTLRDDLIQEVKRLAEDGRYDYILIESTGIGEPVPIAQTFTYEDEESGIDLGQYCQLDTMVTVVDAYRFWHDFSSGETLLERQQATGEDDTREVVDLLVDQIEFCDVLILNKCDMVEAEDLVKLEHVLRTLQPGARFIRAERGQINPATILNTGLFDFEKASTSAGWLKELEQEEHTSETDEYGISSFVYRKARPFHPQRLADWMENWPAEVVRAKGVLWVASNNELAMSFSQAGPSIQISAAGQWVAAMSEEEQRLYREEDPEWAETWDARWGDRLTEFVLIGIGLDRAELTASLDRCVLTDEEMELDWSSFQDPLPNWSGMEDSLH